MALPLLALADLAFGFLDRAIEFVEASAHKGEYTPEELAEIKAHVAAKRATSDSRWDAIVAAAEAPPPPTDE